MPLKMVQSCGHYKDNSFASMENFLHSSATTRGNKEDRPIT
jgi:hypothetical protein